MKILVVEDDRKVAGFIEQGLREEGYAVDVAPDGEEGTTLAHVYEYDLLVLDVMLPKKNGLQVAQELRREGRKTPILMLTARDTTEDVVRRRRRLSRQALQVRRAAGPRARAARAGRGEPHRAAELWAGRARPLEAQGQGQGQEARAHAQRIPAARAFPAAAGGGHPAHRAAREGLGPALRSREQRGRARGQPAAQ